MTLLKTWDPFVILSAHGVGYNYAIIILDRPITIPFSTCRIINLWQNAAVRITVDGGTDRWLLWLEKNNVLQSTVKQPDLVTGDMDSIQTETLEMYRKTEGSTVVFTEDQNETDYTKALRELKKYAKLHHKQIDFAFTITEDSGRFDQLIGNVNTLFKAASFLPTADIFILANDSLSWLLWTGSHKINVPSAVLEYSRWCSLIPFGSKAHVTSTGLKWNLTNSVLAFGQMVSTSNAFTDSPEIIISTDSPIVWSMDMNSNVIV